MNNDTKDTKELSRRKFLVTGAGAAAATSIIAIRATAAPDSEELNKAAKNQANPSPVFGGDPVTTTDVQTLTNKTIPSRQNILGTDAVNIREYSITGTNITNALNSAITYLSNTAYGGQILIPHGDWTTNGGHDLVSGISIEGVGPKTNILGGSVIKLNSGQSNFVFRIKTLGQNCSLRRLTIDMENNSNAIGLLLTDHVNGTIQSGNIYFTNVEEVTFRLGAYGIKVDSKETSGVSTNVECIMNRFERISFVGCQTSFSCNSNNGGYSFDNCYFNLPTPNGTALDCKWMGNMSVEHCLFVGNQPVIQGVPLSDGSTILKKDGTFNNISFYDCQDENVEFMYKNGSHNFEYASVVFRNCLIQSKLHFTASGSVVFDSCVLGDLGGGVVTDTSTAYVWVFVRGINNCFTPSAPTGGNIGNFVNNYSKIVYEGNRIGAPAISSSTGNITAYGTRGTVIVGSGTGYVTVYCYYVNANSLVFAQLRTFDSGGATIRNVECGAGYFTVHLTQNAAANLSISYMIEN